jgi:hypothetical protein
MNSKIIEGVDSPPKEKAPVEEKDFAYLITGEQLYLMKPKDIPNLWDIYIPNQGLVALTGSSDVGKTSLLRQLAISTVLKKETFLGKPLKARYGRVLYISTEENRNSINQQLRKQIPDDVKPEDLKGLCYIFNSEHTYQKIEEQLKFKKADAVIIDCFTDIFEGMMNDVISVRKYLKKYDRLAIEHDCVFIMLVHNGKRTDHLEANKSNIVGSQALEAKMRLVMELKKKPDSDMRFLTFTKGNYLPDKLKNVAMQLIFNEKQEFEFTGILVGKTTAGGLILPPREFDEKSKAEIMTLVRYYRDEKISMDKMLVILDKEVPRVPSKGTLSNWIKEDEESSQSAEMQGTE